MIKKEKKKELGCEFYAFDSTGEFTKAGEKAYDRLEHLLYDIERLTGKEVTPIIRELDKISNENYINSRIWTLKKAKNIASPKTGNWR